DLGTPLSGGDAIPADRLARNEIAGDAQQRYERGDRNPERAGGAKPRVPQRSAFSHSRRFIMAQGRSADKGPPTMPEIDCRALGSRRRTDHDARVCARPGVALRPQRGARWMIGRAALSGLLVAFAVSCGRSHDGSVPTIRSATIA